MEWSCTHLPSFQEKIDQSGQIIGFTVAPFFQPTNSANLPHTAPEDFQTNPKQQQKKSKKSTNISICLDPPKRCSKCLGYMNSYCQWGYSSKAFANWTCAICNSKNSIKIEQNGARYTELPEYQAANSEYETAFSPTDQEANKPVFLALVDIEVQEKEVYFELLQNALLGVLQTLPDQAFFGLCSVSDSFCIYDLKGSTSDFLHGCIFQFPKGVSEADVGLEDLFSTDSNPNAQFFVKVGENRDMLQSAIQRFCQQAITQQVTTGKRGLGGALSLLMNYFEYSKFVHFRVLAFLANAPNYGAGSLQADVQDTSSSSLTPSTTFYRDIAIRANRSTVCFDLVCLAEGFIGLASLKFLSVYTGGKIFLYDIQHSKNCLVAQDLYKFFSQPMAYNCSLKVRVSDIMDVESFQTNHLVADPHNPNLFYVSSVNPDTTFSFLLSINPAEKFSSYGPYPTTQVAFSYTIMCEKTGEPMKRIRVLGGQGKLATTFRDVYASGKTHTQMALLLHQAVKRALDHNIASARDFLYDWLGNFFLSIGKNLKISPLDDSFLKNFNVARLQRLVFGAFESPVFSLTPFNNSDYWVFLSSQVTGAIKPEMVLPLFYPNLYLWLDNERSVLSAHQTLAASRKALSPETGSVIILATLSAIYVLYVAQKSSPFSKEEDFGEQTNVNNNNQVSSRIPALSVDIPFPPPQNSKLKQFLMRLKEESPFVPTIVYHDLKKVDLPVLEQLLVEDQFMWRVKEFYQDLSKK